MKTRPRSYVSMTPEEAREWLIRNDPEAAAHWRAVDASGLVEAVGENLRDFGNDNAWHYAPVAP